jgi:hypothetical protein
MSLRRLGTIVRPHLHRCLRCAAPPSCASGHAGVCAATALREQYESRNGGDRGLHRGGLAGGDGKPRPAPAHHPRHHGSDLDRRVRARHGKRARHSLVQPAAAGQRQHRNQPSRRHQIRIVERHLHGRNSVRELHLENVLTGAPNRTVRQTYSPSQQEHSRVTARSTSSVDRGLGQQAQC